MKYYICEGETNEKYNASSKARKDVEITLERLGYKKYFINTKRGIQKNKLLKPLQLISYLKNETIWNIQLKKLKKGDTIIIQYPILNTTLRLEKVIKKYAKNINIIALIHDINSLRFTPEVEGKMVYKRVKKEDKNILKECSYIIAHNDNMKTELIKLGNSEEKIKVLQLFDYIVTDEIKEIKHKKDEPIIIAGNLSKDKAGYLSYLKDIENVKFNLYGIGYEGNEENVNYKGHFLPEELLNHLEGSFGLVWDGNSKDTCAGSYGNYLRYNNPHKASMYLATGIPVIIWKDSAIANFIIENNLGYEIKSLEEISEIQKNITEEEYEEKIRNIKNISKKLKNGKFLEEVLRNI